MAIETQKFIRKALYVDAVRISAANFDEVATWCQGEVQQEEPTGKGAPKRFIKVRVVNPKNPRQTKAFVGDWLLYTDKGYKVYTNKAFHASFDLATDVEYPREEGDTTVIGPECFVAKDGSVLSWRGVNYVPQESVLAGTTEEGLITEDQARENLGLSATGETPRQDEQMPAEPAGVVDTPVPVAPRGSTPIEVPESMLEDSTPVDQVIGHKIKEAQLHSMGVTATEQELTTVETEDGVRVGASDSSPPPMREGKRVLTHKEQAQMGPQAVRELIQSGEVVLEQDAA